MQAVILVGGEGTRLRPLTTETPKPVIPLVDRPFMAFMLEWLARHDVRDVVMACGFKADQVRDVLGDGSRYGVRLEFLEEPEPRGTAGALKFAEERLQDRFLMLNGDVLTDFDVRAQIAQHERTGATGTLGLVAVDDPAGYGLVVCDGEGRVEKFLEKPGPAELAGVDRFLVSAGIYVLERSVLDLIEPDRNVSIERVVWPQLVGNGLFGHVSEDAYWLDIGTPDRYLAATADILEGRVETAAGPVPGGVLLAGDADVRSGSDVRGPAVVSSRAVVEDGATVERSVLLDGAVVRAGATVSDSILAPGATVGERSRVSGEAILGAGVVVPPDTILEPGVKLSG